MAKATGKGTKENPISIEVLTDIMNDDFKEFVIKKASVNDSLCNYSYKILSGVGVGDTHTVKGTGVCADSMLDAFAALNVHMACIDDVFKHSGIEITDIDTMHGHELATIYTVTGFEIKGEAEDESIILTGNKYISSAGGRIELSTPKITLDNLSSYKWYNELKTAADNVRYEVELYKSGNCTAKEEKEPQGMEQTKMTFGPGDAKDNHSDDDFENAKV